ncbi:MAG: hypothetical protein E3J87_09685 [Candidatus Cloacimonadota bacterium]|nr:MAG: hypothetical protein E3J87_09685 [Candidatus Cloacimonadota bacterium]
MEEKKLVRENLIEKRPPLYIYRAKWGDREIFLNEIIPYITTEEKAKRDFIETVKVFAKKKYNDIAGIIDVKKKGTRILLLEELKIGEHLRHFIKRKEPLGLLDSILLIFSITRAMQKFHSIGIYGLGVEPENIIVDNEKNITIIHPLFPIVEKFFRKTEKPEILNPRYLSPEQISKNIADEKSDLFTIGVILFEMLNQVYPFESDSYELSDFKIGIPYSLRYITERLLNIDPPKRFISLNDFLEELSICKEDMQTKKREISEEITVSEENVAPPPKTVELLRGKKKKRRILSKRNSAVAGVSIILILLLIIFLPKFIRMLHPFKIATLSINKNVAETLDNNGKVLWRFKVGSDISYSKAIDIDMDGRKEVIIGTGSLLTDEKGEKTGGKDNAKLYILNENGGVLFTRGIGMRSIYPEGSSLWTIYDVRYLDIDDDRLLDFIILAVTDDSMDCILSTKIQKGAVSNLWHTGRINNIMLFNLANGERELICSGVNVRMGEKPVVFALSTEEFNDQSPPWGGDVENTVTGLLWYRFLSGGGTIKRLEERDTIGLLVETEKGIKRYFTSEGFEIVKEDTTEDMLKERGENYLECFKHLQKAKEFERQDSVGSALISLNIAINKKIEDSAFTGILFFEKGMLLYKDTRWKLSSFAFDNAVKTDPLFYAAFYRLGEVYSEREKFKDAASSFKKAFTLSEKESYFYRMVDCYTALGNYKKAKSLLKGYEKKAINKTLFLLESAKMAREEGKFRAAALLYEKTIEIEPDNLIANILLADTYADMNENIEMADTLFAYSCNRDSSLAYENMETLAWLLYRKSRFEEAFQKINAALEREEGKKENSVTSRRKLPRLYYRKAIIAQTRGEKEAKEYAIKKALSSRFCKGYVKKQIKYLLGSPE